MNQTTKTAIQSALDAIAHAIAHGWNGITWDTGVPVNCPWVPHDGSFQWQQYRRELADAIEAGEDLARFVEEEAAYVTEQTDEARELGEEAAAHLRDAYNAETLGDAVDHIEQAHRAAKAASATERAFGDAVTWSIPLKAIDDVVDAIEAEVDAAGGDSDDDLDA